jgi:hypothetical protein
VAASGLPDSVNVRLPASGAPLTLPVQVTNNGGSPESYFADARLSTPAVVELTQGTWALRAGTYQRTHVDRIPDRAGARNRGVSIPDEFRKRVDGWVNRFGPA